MEEQTAFCPACGAPQIRVKTPEKPTEYQAMPDMELTPEQIAAVSNTPASIAVAQGIQWKSFIRTAAPLAALTALLTLAVPLFGCFILPISLIVAIHLYGRRYPIPIQGGQGARMGALMGALSFAFFSAFFLLIVLLNQAQYRQIISEVILKASAANPDPQAQQVFQWFATPDGMVTLTIVILVMALIFFLILGIGSGALVVTLGRPKNWPRR